MSQNSPIEATEEPILSESSALFASGFDLVALRRRVGTAIAKAKFKALQKSEQDKRAAEAIKTIKQLIK